jgi:dipeptidyl aminopeptidase/acylaminoacyl peptidase
VLPDGDGPHPLLLWVHGGPLHSWNGWSWRWNPHLMAARGYAVLLPDPALSTGYGREFVRRGWGRWGVEPYTDLMAITDAALEHPAVDASRTAAMGGSFGGYMANWIAGHTDRFRAIVTHASLWDLDQFGPTTDAAYYWSREMTPEMSREHSPSRHADAIRSPVLVIHGDKDYRVPIGEGLRLWWDLCSRAEDPDAMPHRFLYFPSENHWVLTPGNAKVWYETVFAFLGVHVLDEQWETPTLLQ